MRQTQNAFPFGEGVTEGDGRGSHFCEAKVHRRRRFVRKYSRNSTSSDQASLGHLPQRGRHDDSSNINLSSGFGTNLQGVSKGGSNGAVRCLKKLVCFPFWPSGESEDRTEGPQLLLCLLSCQHKKVGPPAGDQLPVLQSLNYEAAIFSIAPMLTLPISIYRVFLLWVFALKIGSSWFEAEMFTDDRSGRGAGCCPWSRPQLRIYRAEYTVSCFR